MAPRVVDTRSPFARLTELLADAKPGMPPISLAVGEPQHPIPSFVGPVLAAHLNEFGRYPINKGIEEFRRAVAGWLGRRFGLPRPVDPETEVLVLSGTREGLFLAALAAKRFVGQRPGRPAILLPNPFYAAYSAGAGAADCEAVYLDATPKTGFLPDLDALTGDLLARTVAFYLASPANPQGAVASKSYLVRLAELAQRHGFPGLRRRMLLRDLRLRRRAAVRHVGSGRSGLRQRAGVPLAVQALEFAGAAGRLRRR